MIGYEPAPTDEGAGEPLAGAVGRVEALLAEWFERPVVLLASGRTGLHLLLARAGADRHRDRIWLPRFLSRCIVNSVTHHAFPSEERAATTSTLLYHQFGFPQRHRVDGPVIEDIAHAFFATATTGARRWQSNAAIFSLPKFFGVSGLVGGVVGTEEVVEEVRALAAGDDRPDARRWMRQVHRAAHRGEPEGRWLDVAYELLFELPGADPAALNGLPRSVDDLRRIGGIRADRAASFCGRFGASTPSGLWDGDPLPFALPWFGPASSLERASGAIGRAGMRGDIYRLDVARDMAAPDYRPCVFVPTHHELSDDRFDEACRILEAQR